MTLIPGDPLAHRALESLLRAEASVRRRLSADLEREGLSASGFSVLVVLTTAAGAPVAEMPEAKAALRRVLRERRAARDEAARAAAGQRLAAHAAAIPAGTVAAFVGTRTEPPTLPLLDALRAAGRRVLLPVLRE